MIRIDLHVHSTFSDGSCTVEELAELAAAKKITVMALTDHDTVEGVPGFLAACAARSISGVSGVELSAHSKQTIHILGYRINDIGRIERTLKPIASARRERNLRMCEKLRALGLDVTIEEVAGETKGHVIARPHFASLLVRKGYVPDKRAAFSAYLADGAPAFVQREALSPVRCVEEIRAAGGLPVLAHPSLTRLDGDEFESLLRELKDAGLWGLECLSSHCLAEQTLAYFDAAAKFELFPTAGSDFHGAARPDVELGVVVSCRFLPWARLGVKL